MADAVNPLALSDEDFDNLNSPEDIKQAQADPALEAPAVEEAAQAVAEAGAEPTAKTEEEIAAEAAAQASLVPEAKPDAEAQAEQADLNDKDFVAKTPEVLAAEAKELADAEAAKAATDGAVVAKTPEEEAAAKAEAEVKAKEEQAEKPALNFAEIGELVMKPFKANGQMVTLKSPEEAIKLMQMGAHFTRKMQAIQPHRKVLTMLENNGLLDEDRLNYLIDLDKKNPEAIKKLIKDAGIDPLEIDANIEPAYQAGSHKVTDAEVTFKSAIEDLVSSDEGKASLEKFNTTWDDASKEAVWAEPGLLATFHEQRENGIYDRISTEIERQKMLGTISPQTSFIKAYETVGLQLHNSGAFQDLVQKAAPSASGQGEAAPVPVPAAQALAPAALVPVATRVAAPKLEADNNDKAKAAAVSSSSPRPAKPFVNPLAMKDEDFLAQMEGRV